MKKKSTKSSKELKALKKELKEKKRAQQRKEIVAVYIKALRKLKKLPTETELMSFGLTRHRIRWYFKNPEDLKNSAKEQFPDDFKYIIEDSIFLKKQMDKLESKVNRSNRLIISTAVTGCRVHKGFLETIKQYGVHRKAMPLFMPVTDPASVAGWEIPEALKQENVIHGALELNSNIYLSDIKMSAKQIDPTTGLKRMGHKMSFIFASTKQRLIFKPNSSEKFPHASMGTGAITYPNYNTNRYLSDRTGKLAEVDHKIGAVIVELGDNDVYHFRQVQADLSGRFADLGKLYSPDGSVQEYAPEFFVMGDLHPGETDDTAFRAWKEVIQETKSQNVVIHDGFDGHSISHWVDGKIIEKAVMARKGMTNLKGEGKLCAQYLSEILSWLPKEGKLYMVASNHNDFLYRYLNDKRFVRDHENLDFVVQNILPKAMQGEDPTKVLVELFLSPAERERVVWWTERTDYSYKGIQLAAHGHLGPNGAKGTIKNHEEAFGACVIGHSHSPGIYREAYQVGTTTLMNLGYNQGPSSWMHTSCLVYPNGSRQLINSIKGNWRIK